MMQIKMESANDFFARGRVTAFLADIELLQNENRIFSFENAADLAKVVSAAKIDLFTSIRSHSASITDIEE
jgi:predicted transcriptional regulator